MKNRDGYGRGRFFHTLGGHVRDKRHKEEKTTKSSRERGESTTQGSRVRAYKDARVRRVNTSSSGSTFNGSCMERTSREQPRADTTMEFLDK